MLSRLHTAAALALMAGMMLPSISWARKPRLRLDALDHSRCAKAGVVTAWAAELELEGIMRNPAQEHLRLQLDGKALDAPPLKVVKFAATKRPLRLALVIQASEAYSMDFGNIKKGAAELLRALPERTEVAVLHYASEARRAATFGTPAKAISALAGLSAADLSGDVALVAAVKMGLRGLAKAKGRKLLVVVSDGLNESPKRALFRGVGDRALKAGVLIHPIAYSPVDERGPLLNLGEIAKRSGGTLRWARRPNALAEQFRNLGLEINGQLGLTFKVPDRCAAAHKMRVTSGRLRSRVVQIPKMKQVKQPTTGTAGGTGGRHKPGETGRYTWVVIPVVGLVMVLGSALLIWFMVRRWRKQHGHGALQPRKAPEDQSAPLWAGRQQASRRPRSTGPVSVQTDPGAGAAAPARIPPPHSGGVQPITGPMEAHPPVTSGPPRTQTPVPFDELPTISPGDTVSPQQPIGVIAGANVALIGCAPPLQGWRVNLVQGEALIGTAPDCLIRLDASLGVAPYHASLRLQGNTLTIEDLESRSGLFVNHQHTTRATLANGDVIQAGQATFQVQIG